MIKKTAKIIKNTMMPDENNGAFVGHIGGDDFIPAILIMIMRIYVV